MSEGSYKSDKNIAINQHISDNYSRTNPLIQTVSSLKGITNNIRIFADSFEQLLNSVENFAPTLEVVAKGTDSLFRSFSRKPPIR